MAASTTKRTAKHRAGKARTSSKRLNVSSKTAVSLKNLRIKQQRTHESQSISAKNQSDGQVHSKLLQGWELEGPWPEPLACIQCRANALRLSKLEYVLRKMVLVADEEDAHQIMLLLEMAVENYPSELPASLNG